MQRKPSLVAVQFFNLFHATEAEKRLACSAGMPLRQLASTAIFCVTTQFFVQVPVQSRESKECSAAVD